MNPEHLTAINGLLGRPWRRGAEGPDVFDCWGLFRHVEKLVFDRDLPSITDPPLLVRDLQPFVAHHPANNQWRAADRPVHGGMVQMAHNMHPFHVGVFLDVDGGAILHCAAKVGVTWDPLLHMKAAGWRRFVYHDWIGGEHDLENLA